MEKITNIENLVSRMPDNSEKFEGALTKVKMFYDYIEDDEEYQYALVYNWDRTKDEKEYVLIYTSELTGEVYSIPMNYLDIEMHPDFLPRGYLAIENTIYYDTQGFLRILQGVAAHNGRVVLEPIYKNVTDVSGLFLVATRNDYEDIDEDDKEVIVVDYQNNVYKRLYGKVQAEYYEICLKGEEFSTIVHIWDLKKDDKIEYDPSLQVLAAIDGKLYKIIDERGFIIKWHKNPCLIEIYVPDRGIEVFNEERILEIIEKSEPLEPIEVYNGN